MGDGGSQPSNARRPSIVAQYAAQADAMMFCLSKGLGAPVGSVLAGDTEFIREARRLKIVFGAAWRR